MLVSKSNFVGLLQGSSKSGFLGEASIDFADFVAETEPMTISLPLKFANSGIVLHVSTLDLLPYLASCFTLNSQQALSHHSFLNL